MGCLWWTPWETYFHTLTQKNFWILNKKKYALNLINKPKLGRRKPLGLESHWGLKATRASKPLGLENTVGFKVIWIFTKAIWLAGYSAFRKDNERLESHWGCRTIERQCEVGSPMSLEAWKALNLQATKALKPLEGKDMGKFDMAEVQAKDMTRKWNNSATNKWPQQNHFGIQQQHASFFRCSQHAIGMSLLFRPGLIQPFLCIEALFHIQCKLAKNTVQLVRLHADQKVWSCRSFPLQKHFYQCIIYIDFHCVVSRWNLSFFRSWLCIVLIRSSSTLSSSIMFLLCISLTICLFHSSFIPHGHQLGQFRASCKASILAGSTFAQQWHQAVTCWPQSQIGFAFKGFNHRSRKGDPLVIFPFHIPSLPQLCHWCHRPTLCTFIAKLQAKTFVFHIASTQAKFSHNFATKAMKAITAWKPVKSESQYSLKARKTWKPIYSLKARETWKPIELESLEGLKAKELGTMQLEKRSKWHSMLAM